ncbi:MAG: BT_3987 domain-containing protein [Mangrovibacterium sp.]
MKNIKKLWSIVALFAFIAPTFVACEEDDELNSKELVVYLRDWKSSGLEAELTYDNDGNSVVAGDDSTYFVVYLTREATVDVIATIEVDETLVAAYNEENKTSYKVFPKTALKDFDSEVKIPAGCLQTPDTVVMKFDVEALTPGNYLLPIAIESVKSEDKGIYASSTAGVIYKKFTVSIDNVAEGNLIASSPYLSRTKWSVTTNDEYNPISYGIDKLTDDDVDTYWSGTGTVQSEITVDMGEVKTVQGFSVYYKTSSGYYAPTYYQVFVSDDGESWDSYGQAGSYASVFAYATKEAEVGINFIKPVSKQYYKIKVIAVRSSSYSARLAELNAY